MARGTAQSFWAGWAPYWEHLEDRHFGTDAAAALPASLPGPILVVGAGHGVAAAAMARGGERVAGVDRDRQMASFARSRRGLCFPCAEGDALPFPDDAFGTAVLSSGVADYGAEPAAVSRVVAESLRVLRPEGTLVAAYYRIAPGLETIFRRIGVIEGQRYHLGRLFEIGEIVRRRPLDCIGPICSWTGRGRLSTTLYWMRMGIARPRALRQEQVAVDAAFAAAARDGVDRRALVQSVPDVVPLWNEGSASRALEAAGARVLSTRSTEDCLMVLAAAPAGEGEEG